MTHLQKPDIMKAAFPLSPAPLYATTPFEVRSFQIKDEIKTNSVRSSPGHGLPSAVKRDRWRENGEIEPAMGTLLVRFPFVSL